MTTNAQECQRWFAPRNNRKLLIALLLAAALSGAVATLSVERIAPTFIAPPLTDFTVPDDDGVPATWREAKDWTFEAMLTHILQLLARPGRSQREKNWDAMWVVRYKKILQRLEFAPQE